MPADTIAGLEIPGLEIPSGPQRQATVRLVEYLERLNRLTIEHETLIQLMLRLADVIDRAGQKAAYYMPGLVAQYQSVRAELLELTASDEDEVQQFDVVLLPTALPNAS